MRKIWKYDIPITADFSLPLPAGAKVLCVANQFDKPKIWCEIETTAPITQRHFATFGTGHELPPNGWGRYVGTYQIEGGMFVWHLYEKVVV